MNSAFCQSVETSVDSTEVTNDDFVYTVVEEKPEFVGGIKEFYNYVGRTYRVPSVGNLRGKLWFNL